MAEQIILTDHIGVAATYEQLAEECIELAHAAMKIARSVRNENPVHGKTAGQMMLALHEETADVIVTIDQLYYAGLLEREEVINWIDTKNKRMEERFKDDRTDV